MLKTSPVLASSANASPTDFYRASSSRPHRALSPSPSALAPTALAPTAPASQRAQPPDAPTRVPSEDTSPDPPLPAAPVPGPAESPNKRRASSSDVIGPCHGSRAPESSSKRPRANEQPPKTLPWRYELCAIEDMVELVAHMLAELMATNDTIRISSGGLTRFHSR